MVNSEPQKPSSSMLRKNVVINTIFRVLMIIAPFITAPYVSRILLSDGVGVYSYTQSLVTYFTMFAALGTVSYGTREISRRRDDPESRTKAFWEIELISILCSIASLSVWLVLSFLYTEYKVFLLIFSFSILATCLDISWFYAGLEKYKYTVSINLFFKILSVVLIFVFVKTPNDVWKYILIYSGSMFLGNLSMWVFLPKFLVKAKIDKHSLKGHFKETLIYFIPTIAASLYTVLDKTLIGLLIEGQTTVIVDGQETTKKISEIESGYYEQATKIIDMIKAVSFVSIGSVMCSRISYLYKIDDKDNVKKLTLKTFEITLFLSIGAMFGIIGIANTFVPLFFGDGYEKTITLLRILACLIPIICISGVLGSTYYTPAGKRKQSSYFLIAGAALNLLLSAGLIIFFKSIGAAIASIVAETLIMVLYIIFCKKAITLKELFFILWKKVLAGLAMLLFLIMFDLFIKQYFPSVLVYVLTVMVSGAIIYFLLLALLRDNSVDMFFSIVKNVFHVKGKGCKNYD